jgi:hypothetical protein
MFSTDPPKKNCWITLGKFQSRNPLFEFLFVTKTRNSYKKLPCFRSMDRPSNTFVLDKKSLQLTLLSLIQDDRFIDLVHSQYLKVVRTRAAKIIQQAQSPSQHPSTPTPPQQP